MQRTELVPSLELSERDCHRLKAVFRKDFGNASGSRRNEKIVVSYVAGVNGYGVEAFYVKFTEASIKSGTADYFVSFETEFFYF